MLIRSRTTLLRLSCLAGFIAIAVLEGCSEPPDKVDKDGLHDIRSTPTLVGEHIYACTDGSKVDADFLSDGLALNLSKLPGGKPIRLTAPATGLTFVGHKVNVTISSGDLMFIAWAKAIPMQCRRIRTLRDVTVMQTARSLQSGKGKS